MNEKIIVSSKNERIELENPNPLLKFDISSNGSSDTLELANDVKAELETEKVHYTSVFS